MEKEHIEELRRLRETALTALRAGTCDQGMRLLYLLAVPSWEPSVNCEICRVQARHLSPSHLVVVTRWRSDTDAAKFATPTERLKHPQKLTPTFEKQSFETTAEHVNCILGKFKAISIPTLTNADALVLDGTDYEVGLKSGSVWSRFHWREKPPPA